MLNERARLAVLFAQREARESAAPQVDSLQLVAGLLHEDEGIAADLLAHHGVRLEAVRAAARDDAARWTPDEEPPLSPTVVRVLERAELEAKWLERDHAGTAHVLLGLLHEDDGGAIRLLLDAGLSEARVREELVRRTDRGRRGRW